MLIIENQYHINYTNHFKVDNKIFAFRKKLLFDITVTPTLKKESVNNGSIGYWIGKEFYSISKIKSIIKNEPVNVNVDNLQWYVQEQLDGCFNL